MEWYIFLGDTIMNNILFFDIDGTLANGLEVPLSAQIAIEETRRKGNCVIICTGRPVNYVQKNFGQYADGYICFNGRYGEINGRVLYDCPLENDTVTLLTGEMDKLALGYEFFNNHGSFKGGLLNGEYIKLDLKGEMVYNFNIFFEDHQQYDKAVKQLKAHCIFNPHGKAPHADTTIIGSDKGTAIKAILSQLDIPFENTYAFGDGANDVSMLRAVAHGVAMGNAMEETKKAAEFITDSIDEDGIMNALKHYYLL